MLIKSILKIFLVSGMKCEFIFSVQLTLYVLQARVVMEYVRILVESLHVHVRMDGVVLTVIHVILNIYAYIIIVYSNYSVILYTLKHRYS